MLVIAFCSRLIDFSFLFLPLPQFSSFLFIMPTHISQIPGSRDDEYDETVPIVMRGPPGEPGRDGRDGVDGEH